MSVLAGPASMELHAFLLKQGGPGRNRRYYNCNGGREPRRHRYYYMPLETDGIPEFACTTSVTAGGNQNPQKQRQYRRGGN